MHEVTALAIVNQLKRIADSLEVLAEDTKRAKAIDEYFNKCRAEAYALELKDRIARGFGDTQSHMRAEWLIWAGWRGNHDQRIEDAKCNNCGYIHETVYGDPDKLSKRCPSCGRIMTVKEM